MVAILPHRPLLAAGRVVRLVKIICCSGIGRTTTLGHDFIGLVGDSIEVARAAPANSQVPACRHARIKCCCGTGSQKSNIGMKFTPGLRGGMMPLGIIKAQ
jgi:hypothetical protein